MNVQRFHYPGSQRLLPRAVCRVVWILLALPVPARGGEQHGPADDAPRAGGAEERPRKFAPGVQIDWRNRVVELEATVVLRRGPLELFACSPRTREHESVLAVAARPMHIFQAMGLIGLKPGSPMRYDEVRDRWFKPRGQPLDLRVRYRRGGREHVVPIERWLRDVERRRPPEKINWVFAGSRTLSDGRFGADLDGTVICVVDFDTALITVGELHTSANELLWLEANTEEIPPLDTPCTVLIRRAGGRRVEVEVTADGTLRRDGRPVSAAELRALMKRGSDGPAEATVVLRAVRDVSDRRIEAAVQSLLKAGIDRASIRVRRADVVPEAVTSPH